MLQNSLVCFLCNWWKIFLTCMVMNGKTDNWLGRFTSGRYLKQAARSAARTKAQVESSGLTSVMIVTQIRLISTVLLGDEEKVPHFSLTQWDLRYTPTTAGVWTTWRPEFIVETYTGFSELGDKVSCFIFQFTFYLQAPSSITRYMLYIT